MEARDEYANTSCVSMNARQARDDTRDVLGFVDVAEVAADVAGVLAVCVQTAAVQERDVLVLARLPSGCADSE